MPRGIWLRPVTSAGRWTRPSWSDWPRLWSTCEPAPADCSCSAWGQRGELRPRRQRLPQAVRHRGVRADRQRLRADGTHQRRGMGDRLRRLAADQSRELERCRPRALRRRRRRRAERQREHRPGSRRGEVPSAEDLRHRRARWRLHEESRGRGRRHPHRRSQSRDASHGGVPGRRVALPRLASETPAAGDEVVIAGRNAPRDV